MKSLDFMVVGVQKAGTTALSQFISAHPQLALAEGKEVHLFSNIPDSLDWDADQIDQFYANYFLGVPVTSQWGEATPIYLYWHPIIPALKRYNSTLKMIVILRDPVERALSHYQMEYSRGNERFSLWLALMLEPFRLWREGDQLGKARRCYSYMDRGLYFRQIERLKAHFPENQILILDNYELEHFHQLTMDRVFKFLNVSPIKVEQERVFQGSYDKSTNGFKVRFIKLVLRCRFFSPNKKLKKLLNSMNKKGDFPWLG